MITARKRDDNEKPIVAALTAAGATVDRLNDFGVPDLLVGYRSRTILLEVKNPDKASRKHGAVARIPAAARGLLTARQVGQLTDKQVEWWRAWDGGFARVVESPEDAIAALQLGTMPDGLRLGFDGDKPLLVIGIDDAYTTATPSEAEAFAAALIEMAAQARVRAAEACNG